VSALALNGKPGSESPAKRPRTLRLIIEAPSFKISKNYSALLPADMANIKKIRHSNKKRPNRNFAIAAAPAAMPVNPNSAATIAITKR
jgi:hypothetical protein